MKLEKIKLRGGEYLQRDVKSGVFYFRRFTKKTGAVFKSLKTKDFSKAKALRDELLGAKKELVKPKKTLLAIELFDQWLEEKVIAGKSEATISSVKASRAHLAPYLELMLPDEITASWWVSVYIREKRAKAPERKFFNDLKWLKSFLIHLHESGVISKLPRLINPDPKVDVGRAFTDDEVSSLIHFAQNEDLRLAILMASTMGMRRLEIFGLRCDRVDIKAKVIRLKAEDTKTRHARSFAISEACWPLIKERCKPGAVWVFPNKYDPSKPVHKDGFKTAWTNLRKITGVEGRFHDLRHTFLTKAFKAKGANPALICHYAGLSLEVAQNTYLHFNEKDTETVAELVRYE